MLTHMGKPVPILKPFKADFTYNIHTEHQPKDVQMAVSIVDSPVVVESTGNRILVDGVPYLEWIEKEAEKITIYTIQKILKTMVISAVYGEGRYLKQLNKG